MAQRLAARTGDGLEGIAMPWVFIALTILYGGLCCLFAFKEPPGALRSLFRVPAIFIFLPDRWTMPVGRLFVGACCFIVAGVLIVKLGFAP
jgi:hypothetical protein